MCQGRQKTAQEHCVAPSSGTGIPGVNQQMLLHSLCCFAFNSIFYRAILALKCCSVPLGGLDPSLSQPTGATSQMRMVAVVTLACLHGSCVCSLWSFLAASSFDSVSGVGWTHNPACSNNPFQITKQASHMGVWPGLGVPSTAHGHSWGLAAWAAGSKAGVQMARPGTSLWWCQAVCCTQA